MNIWLKLLLWLLGFGGAMAAGAYAAHSYDAAQCQAAAGKAELVRQAEHLSAEHGRAQYWHDTALAIAERSDAAKKTADAAETALQQSLTTARANADTARAQLQAERKNHAFDDVRDRCIASAALRLRLDTLAGATGAGGAATQGPDSAARAAAGAGAGAASTAAASCLTADQADTGLLNWAEYIGVWGARYDSLRGWSLDPLGAHPP